MGSLAGASRKADKSVGDLSTSPECSAELCYTERLSLSRFSLSSKWCLLLLPSTPYTGMILCRGCETIGVS